MPMVLSAVARPSQGDQPSGCEGGEGAGDGGGERDGDEGLGGKGLARDDSSAGKSNRQVLGPEQYSRTPVAMAVPGCVGEGSQATWSPAIRWPGCLQLKAICSGAMGLPGKSFQRPAKTWQRFGEAEGSSSRCSGSGCPALHL